MKVEIKINKEVDIRTLHVEAGARYWEDSTVNGVEDSKGDLIPCRDGDYWKPIIDIEKGQVMNWEKGTIADIHYKVCDDGTYYLKDKAGKTILKKEGYVPHIMCPEGEGFGDYIIMKIDGDGFIENWDTDISDFLEEED